MSEVKLVLSYSLRLVRREWRRFILPFFSLMIISVVLMLTLLLAGSSAGLLKEEARELNGGDVVFESALPVEGEKIFSEAGLEPEIVSRQMSFSGTLQSRRATAPFTLRVVDEAFPLYGEMNLAKGVFDGISENELLVDETGLRRLGVEVGEVVSFGEASFVVSDLVLAEPTSLFAGFRFLPSAFMSRSGFARANIDPRLLRAEYTYAAVIPDLTALEIESLKALEERYPALDIDIAGIDQRGLQFGLATVSDFLVIAVLVTAILAAVNVYASIMYLIALERKSLAILLALGLTKTKLIYLLGAALCAVTLLANALGVGLGAFIFEEIREFVSLEYYINLPEPDLFLYAIITSALVVLISLMSFVPAVQKSLSLNPKQILIGGTNFPGQRGSVKSILLITASTLIPLIALASFLLESLSQGALVILAIALVYVLVAGLYGLLLGRIYAARARFSLFWHSIVSQKFADGLFGVVSFTSLFVALTALSTLVLIQVSLKRFLVNDLSQTVPSTYVLDVQPSQKEPVLSVFPELELFLNIGARIVSIDGLMIQKELEAGNKDVNGELAREFNLTARRELLSSEEVVSGTWAGGARGEISVDEEFAKQANIKLGSTVTFVIQGFEVTGIVTSLRKTDSRSGLPFFYFVLSPDDLEQFPGVFFGYAYYGPSEQASLGRYLAEIMPNVSMIETQSIGPLLLQIVNTLLLLVLIVTIPPLLIATLLIAVLVVSAYATRRREGARFRALGMSRSRSFWQYLAETVSVTIIASFLAYGLSVLSTLFISSRFLQLSSTVLFAGEIVSGLVLIIFFIVGIALYLYKTDTMPLRELLSYE